VWCFKVSQLKVELDKMQSANLSVNSRADKLSADCSRLQELSTHQRKQLDELRDKLSQHDGRHRSQPVSSTPATNSTDLLGKF